MSTQTVYDQQKQAAGRFSTIVFTISGLYLFVANGGVSSLFSLKALLFFGAGMFAAAIFIGTPAYLLQRGASKALMKGSSVSVGALQGVGYAIMGLQIVATFLLSKMAYTWLVM